MGMASDLDAFADRGNIGVPGAKADVAGAQLRITASSGRHGRRRARIEFSFILIKTASITGLGREGSLMTP